MGKNITQYIMKKSFTLLATITFQNLFYASTFNDILSKEDNIEEHEKMWTLLKNHFRTKSYTFINSIINIFLFECNYLI